MTDTIRQIQQRSVRARERIAPMIYLTPLLPSHSIGAQAGSPGPRSGLRTCFRMSSARVTAGLTARSPGPGETASEPGRDRRDTAGRIPA